MGTGLTTSCAESFSEGCLAHGPQSPFGNPGSKPPPPPILRRVRLRLQRTVARTGLWSPRFPTGHANHGPDLSGHPQDSWPRQSFRLYIQKGPFSDCPGKREWKVSQGLVRQGPGSWLVRKSPRNHLATAGHSVRDRAESDFPAP